MRILIALFFLACLTASTVYFVSNEGSEVSSNVDLNQLGTIAYKEKRYDDAFKWFQRSASYENRESQYRLAIMYQQGEGTDKDDATAFSWMEKSANKGYVDAKYAYAIMLEFGRGTDAPKPEDALKWYSQAAIAKQPDALLKLALVYLKGTLDKQDLVKALSFAAQAEKFPKMQKEALRLRKNVFQQILTKAKNGNAQSQYQVATMYYSGNLIEQDIEKANSWFLKAANQNHPEAQYILGKALAKETENWEKGLSWLTKAAKQGHTQAGYARASLLASKNLDTGNSQDTWRWLYHGAQNGNTKALYNLATSLHQGLLNLPKSNFNYEPWLIDAANGQIIFAQNDLAVYQATTSQAKNSIKWFTGAARQDSPKSQFNLGLLLARGIGTLSNDDKALYWWKKAAKAQNIEANYMLGLFYNLGRGVSKSEEEAVKWYQEAADHGHKDAAYNLSLLYLKGHGLNQDYKIASKYLNILALQEDTEAQNLYASLVLDGKGTTFSPKQAAYWFEKAAKAGNVKAMFNIATQYRRGVGVNQDDKKALSWYMKAARLNYAPAQNAVGYMYAEGRGIKADNDAAEEWFLKAADNGLALANKNIKALQKNAEFSLVTLQVNTTLRDKVLTDRNINLSTWLQAYLQPVL